MAKKKRKPDRKGPRPRKRPGPTPSDLPSFDPREMEAGTYEFVRSLHGKGAPETPLEKAQALMYEAFKQHSPQRRTQLAREALAISPDCADAYVLLAEHCRIRKEAIDLLEKAVAAGERALGPEAFQRDVGRFW